MRSGTGEYEFIGIDPGSRVTGYGVVRTVKQRTEYLTCGCIRLATDERDTPAFEEDERLGALWLLPARAALANAPRSTEAMAITAAMENESRERRRITTSTQGTTMFLSFGHYVARRLFRAIQSVRFRSD